MTTKQIGPLNMRASLGSVDVKARTVEMVWTTGARVTRSSWFDGPWIEELSLDPAHVRMGRLQSGRAPFLANHDSWDVARTLGVIDSAKLKPATAVVRFPSEGIDPQADQVFAKIAERIITNVSVGYRIHQLEEVGFEGTGRDAIPVRRATDWEPFEVSAVAIGADAGAAFRSEQQTNPCTIIVRNVKGNTVTTPQTQSNEGEQMAQAERERVSGIRAAVKIASLGDDVAQRLIASNTNLSDARNAVLEILVARSNEFQTVPSAVGTEGDARWGRVTGGVTAGENFQRAAAQSLMERAAPGLVRLATERGVEGFSKSDLGSGNEFRRMGLFELARESLERSGVRTRGMGKEQLVGMALTMRASAGDFPILLENAIGKILLAAYETAADTWRKFCKVELVPNFRDAPRYRAGTFGSLPVVPEGAEYKNVEIPDGSKLSIATETRGGIIALTRQAIINDDLGAFSDLAVQRGRAAMLTIENEVYRLLGLNGGLGPTVDGNPFFHATNGNVGTPGALSVASIDADRVTMGAQKDSADNEFLNLRPKILLVPAGLGGAARVLNEMQFDGDPALAKPNSVRGLYSDVVDSPRLSGTRRYSFADPSIAPALVVAFLEEFGQQPHLESREGFRVDGVEWKVRLDVKVNPFDTNGAVTNAGAP